MKNFDYYYGNESEQFSFYRLPRELFTNKYYRKLSPLAKILYGLLLDRMSLSQKNGWLDEENRVYIIFKVEEVREFLDCGRTKAIDLFNELIKYNLIKKEKQGMGKPALIYVFNIYKETDSADEQQQVSESQNTDNRSAAVSNNNDILPLSATAEPDEDVLNIEFEKGWDMFKNCTELNHGEVYPSERYEMCTSVVQNTNLSGTESEPQEVQNVNLSGTESIPQEVQNLNPSYNNSYIYINNTDFKYTEKSNTECSCSCYVPDIEDIKKYINDNNYTFDAKHFYDYYNARNWCLGNVPIANFESLKSLMNNWQLIERKREATGKAPTSMQPPKGVFNNYNQHIYSEDEITEILKRKEEKNKLK